MNNDQQKKTEVSTSLHAYVIKWQEAYVDEVRQIDLFDTRLTSQWSIQKKQYFAKVFYHARGHFIDFLWWLGNTVPNKAAKKIILDNITEEINPQGLSHEELYFAFADDLGIDVRSETVLPQWYLSEIKDFNQGHLTWLQAHTWKEGFAAFSAYEKLDNVDYLYLLELARSFGLSKKGLTFFSLHARVEHFEVTHELLTQLWDEDPAQVELGFKFIASHQLSMWRTLDQIMKNYAEV